LIELKQTVNSTGNIEAD